MFNYTAGGGASGINFQIENALAKQAMVSKAGITTATGITAYNLEPRALGLYFDECPFLELVPRTISHQGDTMTHWKTVTSVDQFNVSMGVAEGQRTGSITPLVNVKSRAYATLGKETNYTFEAEEAAEGFDNVPTKSTSQLLSAFRIGESKVAAYGNASYPLGTPSAPTGSVGAAAGTLPAATYVLRVVALTYDGYQQATVAGGVATTSTRQNNDGSSTTVAGGSSIASAASAGVVLAATGSVSGVVTAIPNAYAYAWYIGTSAANAVLAAITYGNSVTITAPAVGTQTAASITADNSVNPLIYDGLATQFMDPASGAYYQSLDGSALTSDGAGGIEQFSQGFQYMWDNFKIGPSHILCGGLVRRAINKAVFGSTGPVYRIDLGNQGGDTVAGQEATFILNPITGQKVKIMVDPWAPGNFAVGLTQKLPYQVPDVPVPFKIEARMRDYYQIAWPVTTRNKYFGIYYSGVMKVHAPFSGAVWANISTAGV